MFVQIVFAQDVTKLPVIVGVSGQRLVPSQIVEENRKRDTLTETGSYLR